MALASLLTFLTIAAAIGLSYCSGYILTRAALVPDLAGIEVAIVGVRVFGLSRALLRWIERVLAHGAALRLVEVWRSWFYLRLEPLVPAGVRDLSKGRLYASLSRDLEGLEWFYVRVLSPPLVSLTLFLLVLALAGSRLAALIPTIAAFQGLALLLCLAALPLLRAWIPEARSWEARRDRLALEIQEGADELRVAGTLPAWEAEAREADRRRSGAEGRVRLLVAALEAALTFLALAMAALLVEKGGVLLASAEATAPPAAELIAPTLVAFILASWSSLEAIQTLPKLAEGLVTSGAAARRLGEIADRPAPVPPFPQTREEEAGTGGDGVGPETAAEGSSLLEIAGLSFAWPGERTLLRNLELELRAGEALGLAGDSGTGKSTLVQLLSRFALAQAGTIRLEGRLIENIPETRLRDRLAILDQFPALFAGTVGENLRLGRDGATDQELLVLLEELDLLDRARAAEPSDPLAAWVGPGGLGLSGGEGQRLAAGRLLLRSPSLYILDEPAAHLDPASEARLLNLFLARVRRGDGGIRPGLLLVSHRESSLSRMDQVFCLPS